MISPIQQNVVFRGVDKKASDNFTGAMPSSTKGKSVRADYLNVIDDVKQVQQKMSDLNKSGGLNVIA